jgi:hypothetical protein
VKFSDKRFGEFCALCGIVGPDPLRGILFTREHAVSKCLLDSPFPENLPIVSSCKDCNEDLSPDEEYVACAIEVARLGSAAHSPQMRTKVARTLRHTPALAARLDAAIVRDETGATALRLETDRVTKVLDKIARCLWAFECSTPSFEKCSVSYGSIYTMSHSELEDFHSPSVPDPDDMVLLPEIGSRAFSRSFVAGSGLVSSAYWQTVQPDRFRYLVDPDSPQRNVRFVIGEYLAVCATVHDTGR